MKSRILSLAGDTLTYGIFILIGRFLTFLLTPFYTNFLTVEEVGDVGNFFALIAFVNVIYSFGMDAAYFRFYHKDDIEQCKVAFSYSYLAIACISFIFTIGLLFFSGNFAHYLTNLPDKVTIVRLAVLVPFTDCLMVVPYAYLRMTRQVGKFSIIRFLLIVVAVALNIYFVVIQRVGIKGVFYAQLIANLVGLAIFLPIILRQFLLKWNYKLFKEMLFFGLPTVPATFSGMILQVVDRPILKYLTDSQQVGIYMVNYRLAIPMMLFVAMYDYAWRPFYLTHYESMDSKELFARIFKYFVYFSSIIFLLNSFFIEYFIRIPFFGGYFIEPSYWVGLDIVPIVMLGYVFNGYYINFTAGINIQKKTKYLPIAVGISALTNVVLNLILIPFISFRGAAWATLVAYFISAAVIYYYSQKVYPIKYEWKKISLIFFLMLFVFLVTEFFTFGNKLEIRFLYKLLALIIFIILPFVLNIFNRNEKDVFTNFFKTLFLIKKNK
ncbi:MAG: polysaccharide biosynthesis C-terminal domain-containing protein [Ignavibacteria bacterium]|nr:polysaccharide biosynthesis C-terminal domain-containing protein [Ignavibacteria bacterium]